MRRILPLAIALLAACGARAPEGADRPATNASGASAAESAEPTAEPARADEPTTPTTAPDAARCTSSGECTQCRFARVPPDASGCACPACTGEGMLLSRCGELHDAWQRVCGAWAATAQCPPTSCADGSTAVLCIDGACLVEPIADEEHQGPLPCAHPGDCPGRAACVIAALGGDRGCTHETCCGASECSNGCATDADCPSCRPLCRSGSCRSPSGAP